VIKAAGRAGDGRPVLFLGLSGENVTRLAADEPIHISPDEMERMGLPAIHVALAYGRTEEDIARSLLTKGGT
jgi:hypothetical protein